MLKITGGGIVENRSILYKIYAAIYLSLFLGYPIVAFSDLFKHEFDVVSDLLIYELASLMCKFFVHT